MLLIFCSDTVVKKKKTQTRKHQMTVVSSELASLCLTGFYTGIRLKEQTERKD